MSLEMFDPGTDGAAALFAYGGTLVAFAEVSRVAVLLGVWLDDDGEHDDGVVVASATPEGGEAPQDVESSATGVADATPAPEPEWLWFLEDEDACVAVFSGTRWRNVRAVDLHVWERRVSENLAGSRGSRPLAEAKVLTQLEAVFEDALGLREPSWPELPLTTRTGDIRYYRVPVPPGERVSVPRAWLEQSGRASAAAPVLSSRARRRRNGSVSVVLPA